MKMEPMQPSLEYFVQEVLTLAEAALEQGELPIAAVVVLEGKIIAKAATAERKEKRYLVHAEYSALHQVDQLHLGLRQRRRAALYTNLEPCLMCLGAAMTFFLGHLYYGLESRSDGAVALVSDWERAEGFAGYQLPHLMGGILRDESKALFQRYVEIHPPGPMRDWAQSLAQLA